MKKFLKIFAILIVLLSIAKIFPSRRFTADTQKLLTYCKQNGYSEDFCKELVTRSLPEIKECIRRLLNGDEIPHQTFTDDIEPYRMYEGH